MLIQSAFKPDMPNLPALGGSGTQESPTYSWSGLQTSQQPNRPIPVLYGTAWVGGTIINKYITYEGTDEWLNIQVALCHGEIYAIDETDILINNSPFLNYSTQIIDDVSVKTAYLDFRNGAFDQTVMDGFGDTSVLTSIPVKVTQANPVEQVTESSNIDKLEVVVNFAQGLRTITNSGINGPTTVQFKIAYALDGTNDWQDFYGVSDDAKETGYIWKLIPFYLCFPSPTNPCVAPTPVIYDTDADFIDAWDVDPHSLKIHTSSAFSIHTLNDGKAYYLFKITTENYIEQINTLSVIASSTQAYKKSYTTDVLTAGKYKVRLTRLTADNDGNQRLFNDMYLSYVSEVNTEDINYGGIAMVGIKVKATDNLSGEPNFKFRVSRKPINGLVTSNPANAVYDMLTNRHYGAGIDVANIDTNAFDEWVDFNNGGYVPDVVANETDVEGVANWKYAGGTQDISVRFKVDSMPTNITSAEDIVLLQIDIENPSISFYRTFTENDISKIAYSYHSGVGNELVIYFGLPQSEYTGTSLGLSVSSVDITLFSEEYLASNVLKFNGVLDTQSNLWDSMQKVAKVGRGQMVIRGTKYSPVVDKPTQVTQLFNDANILDDSFSIAYLGVEDMASEIEIQYADNALNGEMNQVNIIDTVVESGGLAPNKTTMQLIGATTQLQAITHGRYLLAQNKYIKRTMNFKASIDAIACTVGDVVAISNSIPEWGVGGRVEAIDGDNAVLSQEVTLLVGKVYKVRVRRSGTDIIGTATISTSVDKTTNIVNLGVASGVGDIFSIGEVTSSSDDIIEARIIDISRDSEQTRSITAIEYNESILDFDYDNDLINIVSPKIKEDVSVFDINVSESLVKLQDTSVITRVNVNWNSSAKSQTKYTVQLDPLSRALGKPMKFTGIESTSYTFDYDEPIPNGGIPYNLYVSAEGSTGLDTPILYHIMGKMARPEPITGLTSHSSNGALILSWDKSPEIDIALYVIVINGQVITSYTNSYVVNHLHVGTYEATVRAIDTSGLQSYPVTINATLREPSDRWVLRDTALIEQAFLDGDLTIFFGIGANVSGAEAYDLWKVKVGNLTVDFLTYNSIELDTMSFQNFNADVNEYAFFYYNPELGGTWTLCHAGEVSLIQKLLGQVNATAIAEDNNVRIFNKEPFAPYSIGDLWLDGESIFTCTVERLTGVYTVGDFNTPITNTSIKYIPTIDLPTTNIISQPSVVVTNEQVGYVDNTGTTVSYIKADGSFKFHGDSSNYIEWNNNALTVQGQIVVTNNMYSTSTEPPTAAGLYMNANSIGFWDSVSWTTSLSNGGQFSLLGGNSGHSLDWNPEAIDGEANLKITGKITATEGAIGGWTLGESALTGGKVSLKSSGEVRVDNGSNYVVMDSDGLRGYSDTLATTTFNIPTDGSSPTFSSGTITNVTYEVKGTAAIQVGTDPTIDGIIIDSNGIVGKASGTETVSMKTDGSFNLGGTTKYIAYDPATDIVTFTGSIVLDNFRSEDNNLVSFEGAFVDGKNYMSTSTHPDNEDYSAFPLLCWNKNKHESWRGSGVSSSNLDTMGAYLVGTLNGAIGYAGDVSWKANIEYNFLKSDGVVSLRHRSVILDGTTKYLFNSNVNASSVNLLTEDYTDSTRWLKLNNPNRTVGTTTNIQTITKGQTVEISITNSVDGRAGRTYQAKSNQPSQDLLGVDFTDTTKWIDTTSAYFNTTNSPSGIYGVSHYQNGVNAYSVHGIGISSFGGDIGIRASTTKNNGSALMISKHPDGSTYSTSNRPTWGKPRGKTGTYVNVDAAGNTWVWDEPNNRWGLLPLS